MRNWKTLLNADATDWLPEESNPHIRYFALRWLLDRSEGNKDVVQTRHAIAEFAPIQRVTNPLRIDA